jgi:hypothetical protein
MKGRKRRGRDLCGFADGLGYAVARTGLGHYRATHPAGALVYFSDSADWRARLNTLARLKREVGRKDERSR